MWVIFINFFIVVIDVIVWWFVVVCLYLLCFGIDFCNDDVFFDFFGKNWVMYVYNFVL